MASRHTARKDTERLPGLTIKRVYEPATPADGQRILVDRLWPRGVSKEKAAVTLWLKEIAPSNELRRWFGHEPSRWEEFQRRYRAELDASPEAVAAIRDLIEKGRVTLVYSAHDEEHNQARALADYLRESA